MPASGILFFIKNFQVVTCFGDNGFRLGSIPDNRFDLELKLFLEGLTMKCERSRKRDLIKHVQIMMAVRMSLVEVQDATKGLYRKSLDKVKKAYRDERTIFDAKD